MGKDEIKGNGVTGLIPDFFHDVIAYLIPGFTFICLIFLNASIATNKLIFKGADLSAVDFFFISVIAYVVGRVLEQTGYTLIHHRRFPFIGKGCEETGPKWKLLFDDTDQSYTRTFKSNLITKIEEWLARQDGKALINECKDLRKDDYFNLIQFYLRERFPSIALYEKKQNATIVLTRSLCIGFFFNTAIYFLVLVLMVPAKEIAFSSAALVWILANLLFSIAFYSRFSLDKQYHAMYIFETFIGMKKLLKTRGGATKTTTPDGSQFRQPNA